MAMSPMMQEYCKTKEQYKDCILFYRLGDFFEMFFDDALLVTRELEITLTGKDCGLEERAPMCGVPYHAAETYINRLIKSSSIQCGSWGYDPYNLTLYQSFGFFRILYLLTDCYLMSSLDQTIDISLRSMIRDTTHGCPLL